MRPSLPARRRRDGARVAAIAWLLIALPVLIIYGSLVYWWVIA